MDDVKHWLPIRIWQQQGEWRVDWCWFGEQRLEQPFFRDAVDDALRLPFNQAFRRETSLSTLEQWDAPAIEPDAFIFHASRCGSTLISQMLARLDGAVVISEPPPLDTLLRADLAPATRAAALRGLVAAYGQLRRGDERSLVIKLDAWNIGEAALMRECFPQTPWLFVYRDPLEIAVSHLRRSGMHMVPGMLGATALDDGLPDSSREDYLARRIGRLLELGLEYGQALGGVPVNYSELPGAMAGRLGDFFRLDEGQRGRAFESVAQHAKQPSEGYVPDSESKQREASALLRACITERADSAYQALEHWRISASATIQSRP